MDKSIKTWNEEERPREKLMLHGAAALTNTELLAILLGSGTRRKSAVDLARELTTHCNGPSILSSAERRFGKTLPGLPGFLYL